MVDDVVALAVVRGDDADAREALGDVGDDAGETVTNLQVRRARRQTGTTATRK